MNRRSVGLQRRHNGVPDLVIGNDFLFLVAHDPVFLLVTGHDDINALLQILLADSFAPMPYRAQGGLVDQVGQVGARGAYCRARGAGQIHIARQLDLLGMDLQNRDASGQIGQLHRNAPVKAAWPRQGRIQNLRTVGGRQDDDPFAAIKAVHFRQQLVQSLLTLVIAAKTGGGFTALADGVDLVNEYDAGRLLLGLLEQITDLGSAHAHKHLNKLAAGDGKEGNL